MLQIRRYDESEQGTSITGSSGSPVPPVTATVEDRHLFYNDSWLDGGDAAANADDDAAIDDTKTALLPGTASGQDNFSAYYNGLNGIMVDIQNLAGTVTAADFVFKVGNDNNPAGWASAPAPAEVAVRAGAGVNGSDRVTVTWANKAIDAQWLQVTVRANVNTGLVTDDVFYFGNLSGDINLDGQVNNVDLDIIILNWSSTSKPADWNAPFDGAVSINDLDAVNLGWDNTLVSFTAPIEE
jgi:hypothetical protein